MLPSYTENNFHCWSRPMLVYVAGPYRSTQYSSTEENILRARQIAIELWEMGHTAICPHLNTQGFEHDCTVPDKRYLEGYLQILARCDALVLAPGCQASQGAEGEKMYADSLGIPSWVYPDLPPLHPTELQSPVQCEAFLNTVMKMYRIHLDKNADYSPANILGCGETGVAVRSWDKIARLMNLSGFQIQLEDVSGWPTEEHGILSKLWQFCTNNLSRLGFAAQGTANVIEKKSPRNEAIDDTYLDLANYSIIGYLLRHRKWGR